jgi:hypothetical protein
MEINQLKKKAAEKAVERISRCELVFYDPSNIVQFVREKFKIKKI